MKLLAQFRWKMKSIYKSNALTPRRMHHLSSVYLSSFWILINSMGWDFSFCKQFHGNIHEYKILMRCHQSSAVRGNKKRFKHSASSLAFSSSKPENKLSQWKQTFTSSFSWLLVISFANKQHFEIDMISTKYWHEVVETFNDWKLLKLVESNKNWLCMFIETCWKKEHSTFLIRTSCSGSFFLSFFFFQIKREKLTWKMDLVKRFNLFWYRWYVFMVLGTSFQYSTQ